MKRKRIYIDPADAVFALRATAETIERQAEADGYTVDQVIARLVRFIYATTEEDSIFDDETAVDEETIGDTIADIDSGLDDIFDSDDEF